MLSPTYPTSIISLATCGATRPTVEVMRYAAHIITAAEPVTWDTSDRQLVTMAAEATQAAFEETPDLAHDELDLALAVLRGMATIRQVALEAEVAADLAVFEQNGL